MTPEQPPFRVWVFVAGTLMGAIVAWFLVSGHRAAQEAISSDRKALLSLPANLDPTVAAAIEGLSRHYETKALPIQNRLIRDSRAEWAVKGHQIKRICVIVGESSGQVLRVEETILVPAGTSIAEPFPAEQLSLCRVIAWRVGQPSVLRLKPRQGVASPTIATAIEGAGARLLKQETDGTLIVLLDDSLADPLEAIERLLPKVKALAESLSPHYLAGAKASRDLTSWQPFDVE